MVDTIPVLDFTSASLLHSDEEYVKNDLEGLAKQINKAFSSVGFFYIKNHGVTEDEVDALHKYTSLFFNLPVSIKEKYKRTDTNHGWASFELERLSPDRPPDLKESFNITNIEDENIIWPEEVPEFKTTMKNIFGKLRRLSMRLLRLIAIGLGLDDHEYFFKYHNLIGNDNITTMRSLFYPSLLGKEIKLNQLRCGEHSDYGSCTLLFQDDIGGLEVMTRDKVYIPATPIPGCVIVNIGDLMQKWTGNRLIAAKHRVVLPKDPKLQAAERRSLAFFLHPDNTVDVKSIDDDKDQAINAMDYVKKKFDNTYT